MKTHFRPTFTIIFLFLISISYSQDTLTQVDFNGHLQVDGNKILGDHGNPVQLRGMSLFWSQWSEGSKYYNANVVETITNDWKANVIRIAMGVDEGNTGYINNPTTERAKVIKVVDAAIENGIYVIIDWHSHEAHLQEEEAKDFFGEMSHLYGNYPNVIYEVYNEPLAVSWTDVIKPYCESIIDTIRANDPDNLVICGTRSWSQRVDDVVNNEISDTNVAYTLHYYAATHSSYLRSLAQKAINADIPLFVTEMGTIEASGDGDVDYDEANTWWDFLDDNDISWCNWSIADKKEGASALSSGTSSNGNWTIEDYTESGLFVRNELRSNYLLPEYENDLSITTSYQNETIDLNNNYVFNFELYNDQDLVNNSMVTYELEVSNGGTISDNGTFVSNGEIGDYKLFVTAYYDTLITTQTFDFSVDDLLSTNKKSNIQFSLYPNPYKNVIELTVDKTTSYTIFNINGSTINSGVCENKCQLGEELKNGIYLLQLSQENGLNETYRIIKE